MPFQGLEAPAGVGLHDCPLLEALPASSALSLRLYQGLLAGAWLETPTRWGMAELTRRSCDGTMTRRGFA